MGKTNGANQFGFTYPEGSDHISMFPGMWKNAMETLDTHDHADLMRRIKLLTARVTYLAKQRDYFMKMKIPSVRLLEVTQVKDVGFDLPGHDVDKTIISPLDKERAFGYYDTAEKKWRVVVVPDSVAEKEEAISIPGQKFVIAIYSTGKEITDSPIPTFEEVNINPNPPPATGGGTGVTGPVWVERPPQVVSGTAVVGQPNTPPSDGSDGSGSSGSSAKTIPSPTYVLGDSLTVGSVTWIKERYGEKNVTITDRSGISTRAGISYLNGNAAKNAKAWVIALGTNDNDKTQFKQSVEQVLDKANNRPVYWINIHRPNRSNWDSAKELNDVLDALAKKHKNLTIIDFDSSAKNNASKFGSDGIHLKGAEEYKWRARFYGPEVI